MRTRDNPAHPTGTGPRRAPVGGVLQSNNPAKRTVDLENSISLWSWPSRGGLIVLEHATALDFDFLGFDHLNPPMRRDSDQPTEDEFCQGLLQLGARWFDSRQRYGFVANVEDENGPEISATENGLAKSPTVMERRWVSVGYPSDLNGGLWVAEYEIPMYGVRDKDNLLPGEALRVALAKTMGMKCEIIKATGGRFFTNLEEYDGLGCLKAWKRKSDGEFGPLAE